LKASTSGRKSERDVSALPGIESIEKDLLCW